MCLIVLMFCVKLGTIVFSRGCSLCMSETHQLTLALRLIAGVYCCCLSSSQVYLFHFHSFFSVTGGVLQTVL